MVIHTRTIFDSRKSFDNSKDGNVPQLLLKDERQTVDNAQGIGYTIRSTSALCLFSIDSLSMFHLIFSTTSSLKLFCTEIKQWYSTISALRWVKSFTLSYCSIADTSTAQIDRRVLCACSLSFSLFL